MEVRPIVLACQGPLPGSSRGDLQNPQRRTRADGERSYQLIVDAAARLATIEGLEVHLADEISGLYAHFDSKQDLQLAAVDAAEAIFTTRSSHPRCGRPRACSASNCCASGSCPTSSAALFPGGCFFLATAAEWDTRRGPVRERVRTILDGWTLLEANGTARTRRPAARHRPPPDQLRTQRLLHEANGHYLSSGTPPRSTHAAGIRDRLAPSTLQPPRPAGEHPNGPASADARANRGVPAPPPGDPRDHRAGVRPAARGLRSCWLSGRASIPQNRTADKHQAMTAMSLPSGVPNSRPLRSSLDGPSRTITVEPVEVPVSVPEPRHCPSASPPAAPSTRPWRSPRAEAAMARRRTRYPGGRLPPVAAGRRRPVVAARPRALGPWRPGRARCRAPVPRRAPQRLHLRLLRVVRPAPADGRRRHGRPRQRRRRDVGARRAAHQHAIVIALALPLSPPSAGAFGARARARRRDPQGHAPARSRPNRARHPASPCPRLRGRRRPAPAPVAAARGHGSLRGRAPADRLAARALELVDLALGDCGGTARGRARRTSSPSWAMAAPPSATRATRASWRARPSAVAH